MCKNVFVLYLMIGNKSKTRSEEHTSELQSRPHLVCRLLLEKKKKIKNKILLQNKHLTTRFQHLDSSNHLATSPSLSPKTNSSTHLNHYHLNNTIPHHTTCLH